MVDNQKAYNAALEFLSKEFNGKGDHGIEQKSSKGSWLPKTDQHIYSIKTPGSYATLGKYGMDSSVEEFLFNQLILKDEGLYLTGKGFDGQVTLGGVTGISLQPYLAAKGYDVSFADAEALLVQIDKNWRTKGGGWSKSDQLDFVADVIGDQYFAKGGVKDLHPALQKQYLDIAFHRGPAAAAWVLDSAIRQQEGKEPLANPGPEPGLPGFDDPYFWQKEPTGDEMIAYISVQRQYYEGLKSSDLDLLNRANEFAAKSPGDLKALNDAMVHFRKEHYAKDIAFDEQIAKRHAEDPGFRPFDDWKVKYGSPDEDRRSKWTDKGDNGDRTGNNGWNNRANGFLSKYTGSELERDSRGYSFKEVELAESNNPVMGEGYEEVTDFGVPKQPEEDVAPILAETETAPEVPEPTPEPTPEVKEAPKPEVTVPNERRVIFWGDSHASLFYQAVVGHKDTMEAFERFGITRDEIVNLGASGKGLVNHPEDLKSLDSVRKGDFVYLSVGANDAGIVKDLDAYVKDFQARVDKVRAVGAEPVIMLAVQPKGPNYSDKYIGNLEAISTAMKAYAAENKIEVADYNKRDENGEYVYKFAKGDNIHLTPESYRNGAAYREIPKVEVAKAPAKAPAPAEPVRPILEPEPEPEQAKQQPKVPAQPQVNQYFMMVRAAKDASNTPGNTRVEAELVLVEFNGTTAREMGSVPVNSGGTTREFLPGLIDGDREGFKRGQKADNLGAFGKYANTAFPLQSNATEAAKNKIVFQDREDHLVLKDRNEPSAYQVNGKDFFLRMVSPDYIYRGVSADKANDPNAKGAFGIHPDGGKVGSAGCLVITNGNGRSTEGNVREFIALYNSIPVAQRPNDVMVLRQDTAGTSFTQIVEHAVGGIAPSKETAKAVGDEAVKGFQRVNPDAKNYSFKDRAGNEIQVVKDGQLQPLSIKQQGEYILYVNKKAEAARDGLPHSNSGVGLDISHYTTKYKGAKTMHNGVSETVVSAFMADISVDKLADAGVRPHIIQENSRISKMVEKGADTGSLPSYSNYRASGRGRIADGLAAKYPEGHFVTISNHFDGAVGTKKDRDGNIVKVVAGRGSFALVDTSREASKLYGEEVVGQLKDSGVFTTSNKGWHGTLIDSPGRGMQAGGTSPIILLEHGNSASSKQSALLESAAAVGSQTKIYMQGLFKAQTKLGMDLDNSPDVLAAKRDLQRQYPKGVPQLSVCDGCVVEKMNAEKLEDLQGPIFAGKKGLAAVGQFQAEMTIKPDRHPASATQFAWNEAAYSINVHGKITEQAKSRSQRFEKASESARVAMIRTAPWFQAEGEGQSVAAIPVSKYPPVALGSGEKTIMTGAFEKDRVLPDLDRKGIYYSKQHFKADYRGAPGDGVLAPFNAVVTKVTPMTITYRTDNGLLIKDTHIKTNLKKGDRVEAGEQIATIRPTDSVNKYDPHLDRKVVHAGSGIAINPTKIHPDFKYRDDGVKRADLHDYYNIAKGEWGAVCDDAQLAAVLANGDRGQGMSAKALLASNTVEINPAAHTANPGTQLAANDPAPKAPTPEVPKTPDVKPILAPDNEETLVAANDKENANPVIGSDKPTPAVPELTPEALAAASKDLAGKDANVALRHTEVAQNGAKPKPATPEVPKVPEEKGATPKIEVVDKDLIARGDRVMEHAWSQKLKVGRRNSKEFTEDYQTVLAETKGLPLYGIDKNYGPKECKPKTIECQKDWGIKPDGIVGAQTGYGTKLSAYAKAAGVEYDQAKGLIREYVQEFRKDGIDKADQFMKSDLIASAIDTKRETMMAQAKEAVKPKADVAENEKDTGASPTDLVKNMNANLPKGQDGVVV